jgi:hypothetical protein
MQFSTYRLTLQFTEPCHLPPFKGSTLRGGFGLNFKRFVCTQWHEQCADCGLKFQCVYPALFETFQRPDAPMLRAEKDLPRPFILTPLEHQTTDYRTGDRLDFGLTLVGKAGAYLPYFLYTFTQLGKTGLGRERGRFIVESVHAENPSPVSLPKFTRPKTPACKNRIGSASPGPIFNNSPQSIQMNHPPNLR